MREKEKAGLLLRVTRLEDSRVSRGTMYCTKERDRGTRYTVYFRRLKRDSAKDKDEPRNGQGQGREEYYGAVVTRVREREEDGIENGNGVRLGAEKDGE